MTEQVDLREDAPTVAGPAPAIDSGGSLPLETPLTEVVAEPAETAPTPEPIAQKRSVGRPRKGARPAVSEAGEPAKADVAPAIAAPAKIKAPAKLKAPTAKVLSAKAPAPKTPVSRPVKAVAKTPAKPAAANAPKSTPAATPVSVKATAPRKEQTIMTATTTELTDKFQSAIKDATEKAKAAFEKSQANLGDVTAFAKGNVEAIVESSKILATGLQELGKGYVTESKSAVEALTVEIKDLTTVKSPTEFLEKQSALLRKHFDAAVATSSKNSEAFLKLASEAFQPISNRVSLAVEKIKHAA